MSSNSAELNGNGARAEVVPEVISDNEMPKIVPAGDGSYCIKIFRSSLNLLAHLLIGIVVGVSLLYCFRGGLPLALVAMVFTVAGFLNGWTSWYSQELRKCLPPALSKITHILFGTVAYAMSAVTLCYGFNKGGFRGWASEDFAYTLTAFTGCFTLICIISPLFNCIGKTAALIK
ncbi:unnamed protein product [Danaus chrysippus]|uniref:(African queen) hypothetical protein n=1 Tax=Danaus chrysippus TaxID=151541 RepID=A0A8J2RBC8_9NEOP|nr:unnamed protein product [Danaus chrysippus]